MWCKVNYADNVLLYAQSKKYKGHEFPQGNTSERGGWDNTQNKEEKEEEKNKLEIVSSGRFCLEETGD